MKPFASNLIYPSDPLSGGACGVVFAANDQEIRTADMNVEAANDQNVTGFHLSQPLTQFITGVPDDDGLQEMIDAIAPSVPAGEQFAYLQHNEAEAFIADAQIDLSRPMGGEFPTVQRKGTQAAGLMQNKGLTMYLDERQGGFLPATQQSAVRSLKARILRGELAYIMALIDAAATAAGSVNWGLTTSDPDSDIEEQIDLSGDARGVDSNLVIFGGGISLKRKRAYRQPGRTNGSDYARMTVAELAEQYEVDRVINNKLRKRTSATALTKMVGSAVYTLNVNRTAMADDPSNIKRFVKMSESGPMRVFIEQQTNRVKITVDHNSSPIITSTLGLRKLPVTYT